MMGLEKRLLICLVIIIPNCYSVNVEPVTDDIDDRTDIYRPLSISPQYYTAEKRSYIYPQYDIEKFAIIPEAASDEKRDSIKGPSIGPMIENVGSDEVNAEESNSFYSLKPESEVDENARKFSDIEKGKGSNDSGRKGKHKKITEKEKEAISAGLIKLLYDWKLHKEAASGSGESLKEKKGKENEDEAEKQNALKGEMKGNSEKLTEENNDNTREDSSRKKDKKMFDSGLSDPLKENKDAGNEGEKEEKEKVEGIEDEGEEEQDHGSGDVKETKRKGKISVLVNVNINERSLRSKVSRASRRRQKQKLENSNKISKVEVEKEITEDEDNEDDEQDEGSTVAMTGLRYTGREVNKTNVQYGNTSNPVYPAVATAAAQASWSVGTPQIPRPVAQATPYYGSRYAYPNPYQYNTNFASANAATPATATSTLNVQNAAALTPKPSEDEDESSGEEEYDLLEQKIQEEGSTQAKRPMAENSNVKPAKSITMQNKQRNAQIYLPGSMQTVTEKHEEKTKKKEEDETLETNEEDHGSVEEKEADADLDEDEPVNVDIPKKLKKHKNRKHRKYTKPKEESFKQIKASDEKSTAMPKYSKPKENPKVVTKDGDLVGKAARPSEATNTEKSKAEGLSTKTVEKFGGANYVKEGPKKYGTLKKANAEVVKPFDADRGSGEQDHFVKVHDSEIRLLKEHRAKLQSSEPIVIDDIKKKNEKPKQNPKEAIETSSAQKQKEHVASRPILANEDHVEMKPTIKRNYGTPLKPEAVVPLTEMKARKSKDKSSKSSSKEHFKGEMKQEKDQTKSEDTFGSGDLEPKKYGSLKSVRERFKAWEKEMISKLSNPYLKEGEKEEGSGEENEKTYKSWSEEENELISKLANPFLHQTKKNKPKESTLKVKANNTQVHQNAANEAKKNQSGGESLVKEHLKNNMKDQNSTAVPQTNAEKPAELPVEGHKKFGGKTEEVKEQIKVQSFVPEEEKLSDSHESVEGKELNMEELEKFKTQIMTEVGKISKLQEKYKKKLVGSKELKSAKDTLTKDLKFIKDIEFKITNDFKKGKKGKGEIKEGKDEMKEGKEEVKDIKKEVSKLTAKTDKSKQDPLVKIQSLLQEEMLRTKNKKKDHDKQLDNIRGLLKQELKKLIISGKLGSPDSLPFGLRKLGKMIHQKLKAAKKKKSGKKKSKKNKKQVNGKELKNSLDLIKEYKPTVAGSNRGYITTMSKYKAAMEALKALKAQQEEAAAGASSAKNNTSAPSKDVTNSVKELNATPTKPHVLLPDNLPTGGQADKFKELLKNLNKKIGEVYTRLQGRNSGQQANNINNSNIQKQPFNNDLNQGGMINNALQQPTANTFNPPTQSQMSNDNAAQQMAMPMQGSYNEPQVKHDMPTEPEEKEEPEPDTVMAESEPVETLIENLEKDITEVWSFKEQYPDAGSLGLDNDKIHSTYANLGSLSGLNLRRSLDRALRGKDVGLVIVGGSISKGGPFSEKGVDYALKTYFYAIADWWNKAIRPITGSSMIVRDVSIGGIATDYYSYCLRSHLPNDKMTNIVLWELSANDMRRYEETIKPKQQSLEQFTQEVLSFKAKPALIFLNFFALFSWDQDLVTHCRNFEDEGEGEIAKHYKITSLSWRDMVCSLMQRNEPLFTRDELFSEDQFHPSIEAHAQMAYIVIDYIRTEFLKNLVKQRFLEIGDAARKLIIPDTVYVPKPMYQQTFTWKPLCYTYMLVDNQIPNNTLSVKEESNGDFHYTVLREFKIRSDKIVGMETKKADQYIIYDINVPAHPHGNTAPYKKLAIMSFTDDRQAEIRFDNSPVQKIDTTKKFLEGTVIKYIASNVSPGSHKLTIRSGPNGFVISAIMLG